MDILYTYSKTQVSQEVVFFFNGLLRSLTFQVNILKHY